MKKRKNLSVFALMIAILMMATLIRPLEVFADPDPDDKESQTSNTGSNWSAETIDTSKEWGILGPYYSGTMYTVVIGGVHTSWFLHARRKD